MNDKIRPLRFKNVVYLKNLKVASTFFHSNLEKVFNWERIQMSEINWDTDTVISHIMDPLERRCKGITEHLWYSFGEKILDHEEMLLDTARYAISLDDHSASYFSWFGSMTDHIIFLALDDNQQKNLENLEKFLFNLDIFIDSKKWNHDYAHNGSEVKKNFCKKFESLWDKSIIGDHSWLQHHPTFSHYLDDAYWRLFYNSVKDQTWPNVRYLKGFSTLPGFIKKELALVHTTPNIKIQSNFDTIRIVHDETKDNFNFSLTSSIFYYFEKDINLYQNSIFSI